LHAGPTLASGVIRPDWFRQQASALAKHLSPSVRVDPGHTSLPCDSFDNFFGTTLSFIVLSSSEASVSTPCNQQGVPPCNYAELLSPRLSPPALLWLPVLLSAMG